MHACGYDGHTTMLLAAAEYLARTRNFNGTLNLIFQPDEENLCGARAMIEDGLFDRFPCDAVYAMHNAPGIPVGKVLAVPGPLTSSSDRVDAPPQRRACLPRRRSADPGCHAACTTASGVGCEAPFAWCEDRRGGGAPGSIRFRCSLITGMARSLTSSRNVMRSLAYGCRLAATRAHIAAANL